MVKVSGTKTFTSKGPRPRRDPSACLMLKEVIASKREWEYRRHPNINRASIINNLKQITHSFI
jgi:hypothetical protein